MIKILNKSSLLGRDIDFSLNKDFVLILKDQPSNIINQIYKFYLLITEICCLFLCDAPEMNLTFQSLFWDVKMTLMLIFLISSLAYKAKIQLAADPTIKYMLSFPECYEAHNEVLSFRKNLLVSITRYVS